ncbi:conjugative transposon protein TraK [Bacteroides uniformis]|uniref:conjugative transposon protein TraK n=4 Tax=Bacteroidales TaxID=171549 RepID=UPI00125D6E8F|nr:conjugative transposon protein TraK [Bacteroides uniformis]KAB4121247.1 conjugative transposon protein TraK [Bacteroides uniformis]
MEFKSLKNIETSFRQIRLFTLVFASLCAVVTGFALWKSYSFAEAQRQKIYVLDNGKSLMLALSQDVRQNRPVEAREHVRRFHELFFTLSPDKSAIEGNIRRSLLLADKSAFNYYKDLSEKGYYNRIISGNINQMIEIDSLRCDFDKYPYSVRTFARQIILSGNINQMIEIDSLRCDFDKYPYSVRTFARQIILRESSVTERSLVTRCRLLDAVRSDNNPQGFIIEGFEVTENKDLQTLKR